MANQERGELGVTVEDKPYILRPAFDSLCELEDLIGQKTEVTLQVIKDGRLSGLRAVIWVLLHDAHADEIRTLKDASRWIERAGGADVAMEYAQQAFALVDGPPNTEVAANGNPPQAQAGTGEPSSSVLVGSV